MIWGVNGYGHQPNLNYDNVTEEGRQGSMPTALLYIRDKYQTNTPVKPTLFFSCQ